MIEALSWFVVGLFGLILASTLVFILAYLVSMVICILHGCFVGVEHAANRVVHHQVH